MHFDVAVKNLFNLGVNRPLQRCFLADELADLRQNVKRDLLFENLLVINQRFIQKDFARLRKQFIHRLMPVIRSGVKRRYHQPLKLVFFDGSRQRQQNLIHRRRRHADNLWQPVRCLPVPPFQQFAVQFGNNQRNRTVAERCPRKVNHPASGTCRFLDKTLALFLRRCKYRNIGFLKIKCIQCRHVQFVIFAV